MHWLCLLAGLPAQTEEIWIIQINLSGASLTQNSDPSAFAVYNTVLSSDVQHVLSYRVWAEGDVFALRC